MEIDITEVKKYGRFYIDESGDRYFERVSETDVYCRSIDNVRNCRIYKLERNSADRRRKIMVYIPENERRKYLRGVV